MKNKSAQYIGRVCTFYIPASKLDNIEYSHAEMSPRQLLHEYFVENHNAYTHEVSNIRGYWMNHEELVFDQHERYEVSFRGKKKMEEFISFLSRFCFLIKEDCIYLTMGYRSWLVKANCFTNSIFTKKM